jgi:phasin family protein
MGLRLLTGEMTMSQKPKAGVPARAASVTRVTPKEAATKAAPAEVLPVAESEPVTEETIIKSEPMVIAAPPVTMEPATKELPIAEVEPVVNDVVETAVSASDSVDETIPAASDPVAASTTAVFETITATADTVAAVAEEVVEVASSIKPTRPTITQGMKSMMKSTEDFVAFGQANLEAFVKSGQIWSAGVQELTKQIATSAKASFDESVSTFKAISTAKSVKEAMDLQSTFAKAALEKAMAESNKLTDASIKLTEQTLAPITARVTVAVETFGKAA